MATPAKPASKAKKKRAPARKKRAPRKKTTPHAKRVALAAAAAKARRAKMIAEPVRRDPVGKWLERAGGGSTPLYLGDEDIITALKCMAEGATLVEVAVELGVSSRTLYNWIRKHPEFGAAIEHGRSMAQAWFERNMREGMRDREFNATPAIFLMKNQFPDAYADRKEIKHSGTMTTLLEDVRNRNEALRTASMTAEEEFDDE